MTELVVARYLEDLNWLGNIPPQLSARVYNKAPGGELPNVGREAHSYLHHIVTRYDDLAEVTVFAQGRPFDHAFDFHKTLRALARQTLSVADFLWLGHIVDTDDDRGARLFACWSKNLGHERLDMNGFHRALLGAAGPPFYSFVLGAQFAVTRPLIRARPRSFWQRALEISTQFPDAAHCFERAWDRVFGVVGLDPSWLAGRQTVYLKPIKRLQNQN